MDECVDKKIPPLNTSDTPDFVKDLGFTVDCRGSGKCLAKIRHPISKVWVYLGTYSTPEEAGDVCTRKKLEYESLSVQEMANYGVHTDFMDFEKHPGIKRMKCGKWGAVIRHNKLQVSLGRYDTLNEAVDSYNLSKLEMDLQESSCSREAGTPKAANRRLMEADVEQSEKDQGPCCLGPFDTAEEAKEAYDSKQSKDSCNLGLKADAEQSRKNQRLRNAYRTKSGRWKTEIRHPITKARVRLGTFDTAEEAKEAYDSKRCEFDSMFPGHYKRKQSKDSCDLGLKADPEQSQKNQRPRCVYPRKSGRWKTEIRHPITKARVGLGTFDTAEEAKEAYDSKRREFDSMFPGHRKRNQAKDSCDLKADPKQSQKIQRPCCAEETEEAYNSKRREFDLMFPGSKKLKQSNDNCKGDAIVEGKSDSTGVSDDPFASDGSLVIKTGREEETGESMLNENVESMPMFVTEERGELNLDVVDNYGQLVGEYSRLDDELWLCRSEDDATLEHDEGHEC